jgi:hypothetical protein
MVDLPKPERKAPSLEEMTAEELLKELESECAKGGRSGRTIRKRTMEMAGGAERHLLEKGVDPSLLKDFRQACVNIGYQGSLPPERPLRFGELPENKGFKDSIEKARDTKARILSSLKGV